VLQVISSIWIHYSVYYIVYTCAVNRIKSYLSNVLAQMYQHHRFCWLHWEMCRDRYWDRHTNFLVQISYVCARRATYISCQPCDITSCIKKMNEGLNNILQRSIANSLFIYSTKSQTMVMSTSQLPSQDIPLIFMGANQILYFNKVKNLDIFMNQVLMWNDHVAKISRNTLFNLIRL
jgi:hypothetical protein